MTPGSPTGHSAAAVLRRSLLVWGLGHLAVGDRRGWALLAAQVVVLAGAALLGPALIQGSRWIVLFPLLLVIVLAWVAQAIHAHQRAVAAGRPAGGELQIAWLLPLIVVSVTAFWLVGGQRASPEATLQQYVAAWRTDRPAAAAGLFARPQPAEGVADAWRRHEEHLGRRVAAAATSAGAFSGLNPAQPFNGLRFVELTDQRTPDRAVFAVEITRRQRIEAMLFGVLPTATQQTIVVERVGLVRIAAHDAPSPPWLPLPAALPARVWLIEEVAFPPASQAADPEATP